MHDENEISLKELIVILLNEKKLIALITAGFTILAIIVTMLLPKTYETQSQLIFNLPENNISRYGTYIFPSQNIADYLPLLSSDEVKNEVSTVLNLSRSSIVSSVVFDKENKYVTVKTSASTPELAKQINDTLVDTYINQIRTKYKIDTINKFMNFHQILIYNETFKVEKTQSMINEKLLFLEELSPVYTLQKALFADPKTAALYADKFNLDLGTLSNDVMFEEYVNGKYLEIQAEIIDLKSSLINSSESLKFSEKLLVELKVESESIEKDLVSLNYSLILNDELDILNGTISQVSRAVVPQTKISPRNSVNVAIGFVLGLMSAVFFVFFKHYWKSDSTTM